jgi:hypothetical protein
LHSLISFIARPDTGDLVAFGWRGRVFGTRAADETRCWGGSR